MWTAPSLLTSHWLFWSTSGPASVHCMLRLGKIGLGFGVCQAENFHCLRRSSHWTTVCPTAHRADQAGLRARSLCLSFFLVIKTSSSSQTPQYIIRCVCLHLGDRGLHVLKQYRGSGSSHKQMLEMSICGEFITIAPEVNTEDETPLKGWVCGLRGECYRAQEKVKGGPSFLSFFLFSSPICSSICLSPTIRKSSLFGFGCLKAFAKCLTICRV